MLPMQKQQQLKLVCQIFHFAYKIQQNLTIKNSVKTLDIAPIFWWCGTNFFLHTSMGVGRGAGIWKFQQKRLFS